MEPEREQQTKDIKQLANQLQRLLFLIDNDPATGRKGLFYTVEEHSSKIRKMEDRKMFERGAVFVLGAAGAFIMWLIQQLIK